MSCCGSLPPEVIEQFLARCRAERRDAGLPEHLPPGPAMDRVVSILAVVATHHSEHDDA